MTFLDKVKWVLGILMVFVLILSTNLIDRKNFNQVKNSVVTIYEDRIIANDLIFELDRLIYEKELALARKDAQFFTESNISINGEINGFIERYETTRLTRDEAGLFESLKQKLQLLKGAERAFLQSEMQNEDVVRSHLSHIQETLYSLSKVQLSEGKRQMAISQKALDTVELFTQIEIYFLVFLALLIQVIVMYRPKG